MLPEVGDDDRGSTHEYVMKFLPRAGSWERTTLWKDFPDSLKVLLEYFD